MADPASILGTAVGVTSLGIQACQALSQYYSHFKSFDDDIGAIVKRLDGLSKSLEVLEWLRPKVENPGNPVSKQLQHAVEACVSGLTDLQTMAAKCGESAVPGTMQDKKRLLKKRLLWPFRQETVAGMVSTLDGLQANVQLAMQLLNIEAGHRSHQTLETGSAMLIAKVEQFGNDQLQALATIQQNFIALHQGQMSIHQTTRLLDLSSEIANTEEKKEMLQVIRNDCQQPMHTPNHAVQIPSLPITCTCRKKRRTKVNTQKWWWGFGGLLDLEMTKETEHRPTCELFPYGNTTFTCQADYKFLKRLLKIEIKAGISYMRAFGDYSIHPTLTVKPLVPVTSPAFSPIYSLNDRMGCTCADWEKGLYCSQCGSATTAPLHLQTALNEIVQSFRNRVASPFDTTEEGISVLDLAYDLALHMIARNHLDGHTAVRIIDEFVNQGYFRQQSELTHVWFGFNETVLFDHGEPERLEHALPIYSHRLSIADAWMDDGFTNYKAVSALKFQLLCSEENFAKYDCDCTLLVALHQRSESALHEAISIHDRGLCMSNAGCKYSSSILLATRHWPNGLRILLEPSYPRARGLIHGVSSIDDLDGVVWCAVKENQDEFLHILGQEDYMTYWTIFNTICSSLGRGWDLECFDRFIRTMSKRIAPAKVTTALSTPIFEEYSALPSLFHAPDLTASSMLSLLEAGFAYVDEPAQEWGYHHYGTPLWIHALELVVWQYDFDWELLELMISHGARLDWKHPELLTTPAHFIGLSLFSNRYYYTDPPSSLIRQILSSKHRDYCICPCSSDGCSTIGCAASGFSYAVGRSAWKIVKETDNVSDIGSEYGGIRSHFWALLQSLCDAVELDIAVRTQSALAVLRVLTFDELGLTHTCCRRYLGRGDAWRCGIHVLKQDPEDIEAIRYSESRDLETLEELMIELEHACAGFSGTFAAFLKSFWVPTMRKRYDELSIESASQVTQRLGEVGVDLCMSVDATVSAAETERDGSEDESEYGTLGEEMRLWEKIEWLLDLWSEEDSDWDTIEEPTSPTYLHDRKEGSMSPKARTQDTRSTQQDFEHGLNIIHRSARNEQKTPRRRQSI